MANNIAFKTQIASIMEVLANAAVAEICKLIDDDYAVLRLEISHSHNENRTLKRKLQMMELKMARERAERTIRERAPSARSGGRTSVMERNRGWRGGGHFPTRDRFIATQGESSWRNRRCFAEDPPSKRTSETVEPTVIELEDPVVQIKQEIPEAVLHEPDGTSWKRIVGPVCDGMVSHTVTADPLASSSAEQPGSRQTVVEVSGSDAVLKAEIKTEAKTQRINQRTEHTRTKNAGNAHSPECLVIENSQASVTTKESDPGGSVTESQSSRLINQSIPCTDGFPDVFGRPPDGQGEKLEVAALDSSVKVEEYQHMQNVDNHINSLMVEYESYDMSSSSFGLGSNVSVANMGLSDAHTQVRHNEIYSGSELGNLAVMASKDKRFFCSFCSKRFSCPKKVEIHMRVHTGEKPFSCTQCRMRFAQAGNLKRHQRVHTGEKPFGCTLCEKRFSHLHQLKMHLKVHSGERPFGCPHCTRRFSEKSYLRIHMHKSHSTEEAE